MAHDTTQELMVSQLFPLIEELFEKVNGIALDKGTSFIETLDGVSAAEASRPIVPGGTSIAAHTEHACFYLDVSIDYMEGRSVEGIDWSRSWQVRDLTEPEWTAIKQRLNGTYRRIIEMMRGFDDWSLEQRVGGALGIVAHTAYHLGAIRQILRVVKAE